MDDKAYHLQAMAHSAVRREIAAGKLARQPCEVCGAKAQAHHDSYYPERWLDVRWLCGSHHKRWHDANAPEWPTIFEFHPTDRPASCIEPSPWEGKSGRHPQPWFWNARKCWFVTVRGKRHNLGRDRAEAFRRFSTLLAGGEGPSQQARISTEKS